MKLRPRRKPWDVVVVGGGMAGLSAAIYLGRGRREVLVVDEDKSLARAVPSVDNYLGFPDGIDGDDLLRLGRQQAKSFGAEFADDTVTELSRDESGLFRLRGRRESYESRRVLLATGLFHLPPDLPGVAECIGNSIFFCKDCDGLRCKGKRIGIFGWNDEAVEYALGMLLYSPSVSVFSNGKGRTWSARHEQWLREYGITAFDEKVVGVDHSEGQVTSLNFQGGIKVELDAVFATRGDVYHNKLAKQVEAATNDAGEITVDENRETNVRGLYAAGCVTRSNCQMIIAAGEGAAAGQAINRSLFEESLETGSLKRFLQLEEASGQAAGVESSLLP